MNIRKYYKGIYNLTAWSVDLQISRTELDVTVAGRIILDDFVKEQSQTSRSIRQVRSGIVMSWV